MVSISTTKKFHSFNHIRLTIRLSSNTRIISPALLPPEPMELLSNLKMEIRIMDAWASTSNCDPFTYSITHFFQFKQSSFFSSSEFRSTSSIILLLLCRNSFLIGISQHILLLESELTGSKLCLLLLDSIMNLYNPKIYPLKDADSIVLMYAG